MLEYCVRSHELITCLSTEVFEQCKSKLKVLHPEVRDLYNDLSAHKEWLKDDLLLVHELHGKYNNDVVRVMKFD